MAKLPRIQAIRYPADEGQEVVYGFRLSIPSYARKNDARGWIAEVGKVPDDGLKSHLVGRFMGCADNFYYFRVDSPEQSHTFLATLFLADLITKEEAESVLAKAQNPHVATLRQTIHRLPSIATLGGAFWAGQSLTTEVLGSSSVLAGASTTMLTTAPIAMGCLAVGGAMMLFSRSSRARTPVGDEDRPLREETGMELVLWDQGRRRVNTDLIRVLSEAELALNPLFTSLETGYLEAQVSRRAILPAQTIPPNR
ncbi:hypothetical protein T439DRAFT_325192, partial [Meredithblackwellia eburnea MCA 4105]